MTLMLIAIVLLIKNNLIQVRFPKKRCSRYKGKSPYLEAGVLQVCIRLTYYQGRAGLVGIDAVVGHSSASLGPSDKTAKKIKAKTTKRKAATQKSAGAGMLLHPVLPDFCPSTS